VEPVGIEPTTSSLQS